MIKIDSSTITPELNDFEKLFPLEMVLAARKAAAERRTVNLKSDIGFKLFLCHDSEASRYCLKSIISAFTGEEVKYFKIKNSELLPEFAEAKNSRLDVYVEFNDGQKIDIELQLTCEADYERQRSVFYASKLVSASIVKGDAYADIKSVYQVFITDFNVFDDDENYHKFTLKDKGGNELSDVLQIMFLELPKVVKIPEITPLNKVEFWGKIISDYDEIKAGKLNISGFEEELKMVRQAEKEISQSERDWLIQMARESSMFETETLRRVAEKKGHDAGLAKGTRAGKLESAVIAVRELSLAPEVVAEKFGVPLEDIRRELDK